ncbi:hypothetical protein EUTSA_v10012007mg [Eutrema salsugineum]|uniref:F-box domain-containing protein n=1 Tax=Eutrema salsugineum TaxID=72664 RepID=V4MHT4_EUTSA|nr:hypothetical protein EUTSA_v10012007mg [Eutrema salsugineum]
MMNKRNTVDLSKNLLVEILSRVPAISLAQFRSISKGWNALVKDEILSKKHSALRQSLAIMLINFRVYLVSVDFRGTQENNVAPSRKLTRQFSLKDPLSDSSEEVDICNVFHCDGLLLLITKGGQFLVCNPVSGETKLSYPLLSFDFSTGRFQTHSLLPHSLLYSDAALSVIREDKLCLPSPNKVLVYYDNMVNMVPNNILHIVGEDRHIQVDIHGSIRSFFFFSFLLSYVPTLVQIQVCI